MKAAEALRALDPREARILLSHAWGVPQASLLAHPERELPADVASRFEALCGRRRAGEPVAYLVGRKEFYGLELEVNPDVLIPRPETELLVELALARAFRNVADLGTGSGAVALAIKKSRPQATVVAVDTSASALQIARSNAARLGLEVDFRLGRWFAPLAEERFDLIVANPPYVAMGDPHLPDLRYEPATALVAGADGLDALRELAAEASAHLQPGAWIFLEHGQGQDNAVRALFGAAGLADARTWPDMAGIGRVTGARR